MTTATLWFKRISKLLRDLDVLEQALELQYQQHSNFPVGRPAAQKRWRANDALQESRRADHRALVANLVKEVAARYPGSQAVQRSCICDEVGIREVSLKIAECSRELREFIGDHL